MEVGYRIDAQSERDLPGGFGDLFNGAHHVFAEGEAFGGFDDEHDVVGFGVGVLEGLEGVELRVVVAEEDAVIVGELQLWHAGGACEDHDQGQADDNKAPADDEIGPSLMRSFSIF